MPKDYVNPATLFPSVQHGFSQAVVASSARTVYISGQTAWNANKRIVGGTLAEQTAEALRNVRTAVEAAGGVLDDVVSLRIYIVERAMNDIAAIGAALRNAFPANPPASTWIGVSSLAVPDFLVEIEAIAVLEV